MTIVAVVCNAEEGGVLRFAVMCVLTPTLNLLAILRSGARQKSAIGA